MSMTPIYRIVGGIWSGEVDEVDERAQVPEGWTRRQVPALSPGQVAGWLGGVWVVRPAPPLADLDLARQAKNIEINDARLAASRGTFPYGGKLFACDELARSDIDGTNGIVALTGEFPAGWPGVWKADDNTLIEMATRAQWETFYGAMAAQGTANFVHAQQLKYRLENATTIEQIAAIVW